jgi:TRAP-type C4-dicarboxylate transport system permease small subunit
MKYVCKIDDFFAKTEKWALVFLVIAMVTLSFLQVVMRIFFSRGILWIDPLLRHFVLWAGFFGAGLASYSNKHFALDLSVRFLKGKAKHIVKAINHFFAGFICLLLLLAAMRFLKDEVAFGVTSFSIGNFDVPALMMEFMIPLGFFLVLFHTIVAVFKKDLE